MYKVIPSRVWRHVSGAGASVYGACPWTTEAERADWTLQDVGFTVRNSRTGTVGIGRKPWSTQEEAQTWADTENARLAACAVRLY